MHAWHGFDHASFRLGILDIIHEALGKLPLVTSKQISLYSFLSRQSYRSLLMPQFFQILVPKGPLFVVVQITCSRMKLTAE